MEKDETWSQILMMSQLHQAFVTKHQNHQKLKDIRSKGTILALEIGTEEHTHYLNNASETIASYFLKNGIIVRPLGNILYLIPPYCITETELKQVYEVMERFLEEL
jgi:adenosylmethionine-8-amino-7-oxononanoate aminotransferase